MKFLHEFGQFNVSEVYTLITFLKFVKPLSTLQIFFSENRSGLSHTNFNHAFQPYRITQQTFSSCEAKRTCLFVVHYIIENLGF